jgi:glutamyl-tRNA(Gln) amidotransferase subunit E
MYPETDLPLLKISRDFINEAKKTLPKLKSEVEKELKKQGLSQEMIKILFKQNKLEEYKELYKIYSKPMFIAKVLFLFTKDIAAKEKVSLEKLEEKVTQDDLVFIINSLAKKKIKESDVKEVMEKIYEGTNLSEAIKFERIDSNEIEEKIMKMIKEKPGLNANAYMGLVMKEFKGQVDGKTAMEIIKKYVK